MNTQETTSVPDLREQMARARYQAARKSFPEWPPWDSAPELVQGIYRREQDVLLPILTLHVAAERDRAVAEVVEAVLAVHERDLHDSFGRQACICCGLAWPCPTVEALPAQPANQAQETDR